MKIKDESPIEWVVRSEHIMLMIDEMIVLKGRGVRDEEGKLSFEITVPVADDIVLPDDLGVLLQCFGWGIVFLGFRHCPCDTSPETFRGCCEVMKKFATL